MDLQETKIYAEQVRYLSDLLAQAADSLERLQQDNERLKRELAAVNSRKKDEVERPQ